MVLKELRRRIRGYLANWLVCLVRRSRFSDELGGFLIKAMHFNAPWMLVTNAVILPPGLAFSCLITMTIALLMYVVLDGCFLSEAEQRLGAGDLNVVDPYIQLFGEEINMQTRYEYTIFGAYFAYTLVLSILHLRGII